ncbi:ABC transporter substrate-binding protein [Roseiarcaceae bacterium H3SJ34-1]|uniref:ABC transporter substrate-binding protein n=1 Tax=Terripilifer ovatus TaxID=3032367 RepID=UPI003AB9610C|nr:ABC transporter substrate-binding protein [Roseiarcaceae bacterium H3SJ34-1]
MKCSNLRSFKSFEAVPLKAATLGAALLLAVASAKAQQVDQVALQLSWLPQGQASALFYGKQQACFKDQNIDLTVQRGYGASDTVNKIVTKAAQFGQIDLATLIVARAKNQAPIKAIMPLFTDAPLTIAVRADNPVRRMKDLEGRSLASGPGDGGVLMVPLAMKNDGGDGSKIEYRTIEPSALAGSLLQGRVDSILSYVTTAAGIDAVAKKSGLSIRTLDFGKDLGIYGDAFFASEDMIKTNPGLVARFQKAVDCSYRGAQKDQEGAVKAMVAAAPEMEFERELMLAKIGWGLIFNSTSPALKWDAERLKRTAEATAASQSLQTVPDPATFAQ